MKPKRIHAFLDRNRNTAVLAQQLANLFDTRLYVCGALVYELLFLRSNLFVDLLDTSLDSQLVHYACTAFRELGNGLRGYAASCTRQAFSSDLLRRLHSAGIGRFETRAETLRL